MDLFRRSARTSTDLAAELIADGGWVDVDIKQSVLYLYTAYLSYTTNLHSPLSIKQTQTHGSFSLL